MSDQTDTPPDEATGQLQGEQKFGRAAELEASGWKAFPKQEERELDVTSAAQELADSRTEEPEPIKIDLFDVGALAEGELKHATDLDNPDGVKQALSPEEASQALSQWREAEVYAAEAKADDELLSDLGIDNQPSDASLKPDAVQEAETAPETSQGQQPELDPITKALADPVVADALRTEFVKADRAYTEAIDSAVVVAEHAFLQQFPEFRGVTDAGHLKSIVSSIQQQNPQRWSAIQHTARQASGLLQQQAALRQESARREANELASFRAEQGRAYEAKYGAVTQEQGNAARDYLKSIGVSDADLAAVMNNRGMIDHRFQKVLSDAAAYHALKQNAPKAAPRTLPPVQKPGAAPPRASYGAQDVARASAKFRTTGSINDALALLSAQRAARG